MFYLREELLNILPRWLKLDVGSEVRAVIDTLGESLDFLGWQANRAYQQNLLTHCEPATLPEYGVERLLPRVVLDSDESYRQRLWECWSLYKGLGTSKCIEHSLALLGYTAKVYNREYLGEVSDRWNAFWVEVYGFPYLDTWDSETETWDSDTETWDSAVSAELQNILNIVLRCRGAHMKFVGFVFVNEDETKAYVYFNKE